MYTELNEVVQYMAYKMHDRVPYHKIALFCEHLANLMLLRFLRGWDVTDPTQSKFPLLCTMLSYFLRSPLLLDSNERYLVISRFNYHGANQLGPDDLILMATNSVGLDIEEVLYCLPGRKMVRAVSSALSFHDRHIF